MNKPNIWWATMISLGMVVYVLAAIWCVFVERANPHYVVGCDFIVLALLLFAGVVSLADGLTNRQQDSGSSRFALVLEPYALGWRKLWRTKWLLWIFGSAGALALIDSVVMRVMSLLVQQSIYHRHPMASGPDLRAIPLDKIAQYLHTVIPGWSIGAQSGFVTGIAASRLELLLLVAVLLSLFWIVPCLRSDGSEARACSRLPIFVAALAIFTIGTSFVTIVMIRGYCQVMQTGIPPGTYGMESNLMSIFTYMLHSIDSAIISATLIGGVIGLLVRSRCGKAITLDGFMADAARHFLPLAGMYLVLDLLANAPEALIHTLTAFRLYFPILIFLKGLISLLFIYVPFAVVVQGEHLSGAIRVSLGLWKKTALRSILFIAPGMFVVVLFAAIQSSCQLITFSRPWLDVVLQPLVFVPRVLLGGVIFLSFWEFYCANVSMSEVESVKAD